MKNIRPSLTGKPASFLFLLVMTQVFSIAGSDTGSPASQTPYDRYLAPVRTVLSTLGTEKPAMAQVRQMMLQGRGFHYRMSNPYVAALPEQTAQKRSGDCKDKALWLCSRLGDADVRFVIGKTEPRARINHAWVMWRSEDRWWVLDCTLRSAPIPADEIPHNRYIPLYSYGKDASYRHEATQVNPARDRRDEKASVASNARR
jgi:hypothetical protein